MRWLRARRHAHLYNLWYVVCRQVFLEMSHTYPTSFPINDHILKRLSGPNYIKRPSLSSAAKVRRGRKFWFRPSRSTWYNSLKTETDGSDEWNQACLLRGLNETLQDLCRKQRWDNRQLHHRSRQHIPVCSFIWAGESRTQQMQRLSVWADPMR